MEELAKQRSIEDPAWKCLRHDVGGSRHVHRKMRRTDLEKKNVRSMCVLYRRLDAALSFVSFREWCLSNVRMLYRRPQEDTRKRPLTTNNVSCVSIRRIASLQHLIDNSTQFKYETAILFIVCIGMVHSQPSARELLNSIFYNTGGAAWIRQDNWTSLEVPISQWYGVTTDGAGNVTQLILPANQLAGSLPASMSSLIYLNYLDLSYNSLNGDYTLEIIGLCDEGIIPTTLSALSLNFVNLSRNLFTGSLGPPFFNVDNQPISISLATLDISYNSFTSGTLSPKITSNLQILHAESSGVTGTMPPFASNISLSQLYLDNNSGLSLLNMQGSFPPSLRVLSLTRCTLSGDINLYLINRLPSNMTFLDASNNFLAGDLPRFSLFTQFRVIDLSNNQLAGVDISDYAFNFTNLQRFSVSNNRLTGSIPQNLFLAPIQIVHLENNRMYGGLPSLPSSLQELYLSSNGFSGTIGEVPQGMRYLELAGNQFSGEFNVSSCGGLILLDVSDNYFGGNMPDLSGAQNLEEIDLSNNLFSGTLSGALSQLKQLTYLDLSGNEFIGDIPPIYSPNLKTIDVSNNQLTGPLPSFNESLLLGQLNVANNNLSGEVPNTLTSMQLSSLDLSSNQFSGNFPPLSSLILSYCNLSYNLFNGTIPSMNSSQLITLALSDNFFTGNLPPFYSSSPQLRVLIVHQNRLNGVLPPDLFSSSSLLQYVDVSNNHLMGAAPTIDTSSLLSLDLSSNFLEGPLPTLTSKATTLSTLNVSYNRFTGSIPLNYEDYGMRYLYVQGNMLSGTIPSFTQLQKLDISSNNFSGSLPSVGGSLIMANFSRNAFTGTIPDSLGGSGSLTSLDFSWNRLTNVPMSLSGAQQLNNLDLSHNAIGSLAITFDKFPYLVNLSLSSCGLSMAIPPSIGSVRLLTLLDISNNTFSGPIPDSFGNLAYLTEFYGGMNRINGTIPASFKYSRHLSVVDLSNNMMTGGITDNIASLISLQYLDLSNNRLNGNITSKITSLIAIQYLNVSHNQLTGPIPSSMGFLNTLEVVDFSDNRLTDVIPDLSSLNVLNTLIVSNNTLSGNFPETMDAVKSLTYLDISNNLLSGMDVVNPSFNLSTITCLSANNLFLCPLPWWALSHCNATCIVEDYVNSAPVEIRIDGNVTSFNRNNFLNALASILNITTSRLDIVYVRSGSVIIGLNILPPSRVNQGSANRTRSLLDGNTKVAFAAFGYNLLGTSFALTAEALPSSNGNSASSGGLSDGAKVGIILGGSVLLLAIVSILIFIVVKLVRKPNAPELEGFKRDVLLKDVVILEAIGAGHFGHVYRGKWNGTDVALKSLKPSNQQRELWLKEVSLLQRLNHPNVVRLLGIYQQDEQEFMVLEYYERGSLDNFLKNKENADKLSPEDLIFMTVEIAKGMLYLESVGIIHRDLGARNLLVTESNGKFIVKISDFGMSKGTAVDGKEKEKIPIRWAAPEVIRKAKSSIQSDVWSFGVCVWEIFSEGQLPYGHVGNSRVSELVLNENYRLPRPTKCPEAVYSIMTQCWHSDPTSRPTFQDILSDLSQQLAALDTVVTVASPPSSSSSRSLSQQDLYLVNPVDPYLSNASFNITMQSPQPPGDGIHASKSAPEIQRSNPKYRPSSNGQGKGGWIEMIRKNQQKREQKNREKKEEKDQVHMQDVTQNQDFRVTNRPSSQTRFDASETREKENSPIEILAAASPSNPRRRVPKELGQVWTVSCSELIQNGIRQHPQMQPKRDMTPVINPGSGLVIVTTFAPQYWHTCGCPLKWSAIQVSLNTHQSLCHCRIITGATGDHWRRLVHRWLLVPRIIQEWVLFASVALVRSGCESLSQLTAMSLDPSCSCQKQQSQLLISDGVMSKRFLLFFGSLTVVLQRKLEMVEGGSEVHYNQHADSSTDRMLTIDEMIALIDVSWEEHLAASTNPGMVDLTDQQVSERQQLTVVSHVVPMDYVVHSLPDSAPQTLQVRRGKNKRAASESEGNAFQSRATKTKRIGGKTYFFCNLCTGEGEPAEMNDLIRHTMMKHEAAISSWCANHNLTLTGTSQKERYNNAFKPADTKPLRELLERFCIKSGFLFTVGLREIKNNPLTEHEAHYYMYRSLREQINSGYLSGSRKMKEWSVEWSNFLEKSEGCWSPGNGLVLFSNAASWFTVRIVEETDSIDESLPRMIAGEIEDLTRHMEKRFTISDSDDSRIMEAAEVAYNQLKVNTSHDKFIRDIPSKDIECIRQGIDHRVWDDRDHDIITSHAILAAVRTNDVEIVKMVSRLRLNRLEEEPWSDLDQFLEGEMRMTRVVGAGTFEECARWILQQRELELECMIQCMMEQRYKYCSNSRPKQMWQADQRIEAYEFYLENIRGTTIVSDDETIVQSINSDILDKVFTSEGEIRRASRWYKLCINSRFDEEGSSLTYEIVDIAGVHRCVEGRFSSKQAATILKMECRMSRTIGWDDSVSLLFLPFLTFRARCELLLFATKSASYPLFLHVSRMINCPQTICNVLRKAFEVSPRRVKHLLKRAIRLTVYAALSIHVDELNDVLRLSQLLMPTPHRDGIVQPFTLINLFVKQKIYNPISSGYLAFLYTTDSKELGKLLDSSEWDKLEFDKKDIPLAIQYLEEMNVQTMGECLEPQIMFLKHLAVYYGEDYEKETEGYRISSDGTTYDGHPDNYQTDRYYEDLCYEEYLASKLEESDHSLIE
ncbi:leucine-rich repeat receptor protein kinase EXS-like [Planoprotostelium fungivorum]|uniref:Leucine-rich repeat receptor protein kinase EXS-like n=1 Tax=Planoprotostelium fungivorum TaxID=1890364 RepID=A0A2P6NR15_9EUKA|nr:leucine-rich repeat receptor protein kinase EXS-like [Planoprotostelium fungivorum]